jgi:hypothetical protein
MGHHGGLYGHPGGMQHVHHDPYNPLMGHPGMPHVRPAEHHYHHYHDGPSQQEQQTRQQAPQQQHAQLFSNKGNVTLLPRSKYPDKSSKYLWLVMFHDNGRASKTAKPSLDQLATKLKRKLNFKVGAFDCVAYPNFCRKRIGALSDLTRFAFVVDGRMELYDTAIDTTPSARQLYTFALDNMPRSVIQSIDREKLLYGQLLPSIENKHGAVMLLTDTNETSALYYGLAYKYREEFVFTESRNTSEPLAISL